MHDRQDSKVDKYPEPRLQDHLLVHFVQGAIRSITSGECLALARKEVNRQVQPEDIAGALASLAFVNLVKIDASTHTVKVDLPRARDVVAGVASASDGS